MAGIEQQESPDREPITTVQALQAEAWTAYNSAFHAPDGDDYRRAGQELYRRVVDEQIRALFSRGDEQNRLIDDHVAA